MDIIFGIAEVASVIVLSYSLYLNAKYFKKSMNFENYLMIDKHELLNNLMANRHDSGSNDNIKFLNQILSVFSDSKNVVENFKRYSTMCDDKVSSILDTTNQYNNILRAMFDDLGISENLYEGAIEKSFESKVNED